MDPLISVIIPIHNIEKYVEQCVDSVIGQSFSNIEIILIDDGSSDRCPAICDQYMDRDRRIRVIHKGNGGLMSAWMAGVKESRAPFIVFVDGDDWIEKDMCDVLYQNAESQKADICCCGFVRNFDGYEQKCGAVDIKIYESDEIRNRLVPDLLRYFLKRNPEVIHTRWAKIFRKQIILEAMPLCNQEIHIGEDFNLVFPAFLRARKILVLGECYLYHYRIRNDSLMTSTFDTSNIDRIRILNDEMLKLASEMNYEDIHGINLACSFLYYELLCKVYLSKHAFCGQLSTIKMIKKTLPLNVSFDALRHAFCGSQTYTKNRKILLSLLSKKHYIAPAVLVRALAASKL